MADVLTRLIGPVALTTSAVTEYTVPALTTTTLRNIHVCNESGSDATFTLSLGTDGPGKRLFKSFTVPANGVLDWTGSIVLAAAEVLQALAGTGAVLTLIASGVEST